MTSITEDIIIKYPDNTDSSNLWIDSVKPIAFNEAYFLKLPSQGNIYCTSFYKGVSGFCRLLVASLKRKLFWLWFDQQAESSGGGNVAVIELPLTHVPSLCEVVSIDVMDRSTNTVEVVIGVTLIKEFERSLAADSPVSSNFLNIYSQLSSSSAVDSSCKPAKQLRLVQQLLLEFVPYQLTHAGTLVDGQRQNVFVLSGSDGSVHVYGEVSSTEGFCEKSCDQLFPELTDLPSLAMWIDFKPVSDSQRITAVGCECGVLRVSIVSWPKPSPLTITHTWSASQHDLITSVRLFSAVSDNNNHRDSHFNLLVTCAQLQAVVYSHVTGCSTAGEQLLPAARDVVTCSCVADVNMDGRQEILLGTYSQELLVFAFNECTGWTEVMKLSFSRPLIGLLYTDITSDGVCELCVITTFGVHVLQHDVSETCTLVCKRIEQLSSLESDWLKQLTLADY